MTESVCAGDSRKLGLDVAKLKADKESEAVKGELARVEALARKMNITGTRTSWWATRRSAAHRRTFSTADAKIAALRQSGCAYC